MMNKTEYETTKGSERSIVVNKSHFHTTATDMRGKVLCLFDDMRLLVYHKGAFILFDSLSERILSCFRLPLPVLKRYMASVRLVERGLHCEARWAIPIDKNTVLIMWQSSIYRVNVLTGEYSVEDIATSGKPLNISRIANIQGFTDSFVVGDYWTNPDRKPVNIYQRDNSGKWDVVYTFSAGQIRHIHNIIPDTTNNCVYILTGDDDHECGIWKAIDNFSSVTEVLVGRQEYRCCQMLTTGENEGFYLSDTPSQVNSLFFFSTEGTRRIIPISGTCIYGSRINKDLLFSTTVEPDARASSKIDYWLSSKPGKGVRDRSIYVHLLHNGEIFDVIDFCHDGLPLRLFQYGTVYFSNSVNNIAFFSATCVEKYDSYIYRFEDCVCNDLGVNL